MKLLNIDKDLLLKPLQLVSGIVERRHTLPILSNVLLKIGNQKLEVFATDLEIQISTSVALENDNSEDAVTISARKTLDILRALPDKTKISLEASDTRAVLKGGKSKFNLQDLVSRSMYLYMNDKEFRDKLYNFILPVLSEASQQTVLNISGSKKI